ncbi:MAG: PQQ-binding-like beta-propeller repeat protein [Bacteroidota bacterium]
MKKLALILFILTPVVSISQELKLKFKQELPDKVLNLFSDAELRQFYMTPDGDRLLLNSESGYFIYDLENQGKLIGEGVHVTKSNFVARGASSGTVSLEEGVEYYVFEKLSIALFLDWNLTKNIIKAVDLNTGEELYVLDNYRYTTSVNKQILKAVASLAATQATQAAVLNSGMTAGTLSMNTLSSEIAQSQYNSAGFSTYASPLDEVARFLVKTEGGITCLEVKSGKELWTYESDINIGFAGMPDSESVVLVNFKESELKKSKRLVVKLEIETGKEIWQAEPLSIFKRDRTYLVGDRLVLDYFGAEVLDLNTGEQLLVSANPLSVRSANLMVKSSTATTDPSLVHDNYLYTSTWSTFPNSGSGKAKFQKYDLKTGKKIWETKKVANGISAVMVDDDYLYLRKGKAFGESSIFVLDTKTGNLIAETENVDGFVYRKGAGDILTDKYLYRSGKKSIYVFDKQNWKVISEFDGRNAKIGKLQATTPAGNNLLLIGDKGIAFFSPDGKMLNSANLAVASAAWNDNKCLVFTGNRTEVFNLNTVEKIQDIPNSITNGSMFLISDTGDKLSIINSRNSNIDSRSLTFYQE